MPLQPVDPKGEQQAALRALKEAQVQLKHAMTALVSIHPVMQDTPAYADLNKLVELSTEAMLKVAKLRVA